jgi:hypothetical protein
MRFPPIQENWAPPRYMSPQYAYSERTGVKIMTLNAIFNYISSISWRSVLLVEETGVPRENTDL